MYRPEVPVDDFLGVLAVGEAKTTVATISKAENTRVRPIEKVN
jgi:hypothetical protein